MHTQTAATETQPGDRWEDIRLRQSDPGCPEAFAVAFDEWTIAEIRELLDSHDDVGLAMAYFHRIGFRFSWYQRAPDEDPNVISQTGLTWTSGFAHPDYDRPLWSADARDLFEHWIRRIREHVYERIAADGQPIDSGFHQVNYRLKAPGGYLHPWEREPIYSVG